MNKHDNHSDSLKKISKALIIAILKLLAVAVAFGCRLSAFILSKLSELIEKLLGHGNNTH